MCFPYLPSLPRIRVTCTSTERSATTTLSGHTLSSNSSRENILPRFSSIRARISNSLRGIATALPSTVQVREFRSHSTPIADSFRGEQRRNTASIRAISSSESLAVRNIIGINAVDGFFFMTEAISIPLIPPIITSSNTNEYFDRSYDIACSALNAVSTR